jgi:hypothetical protein
MPLYMLFKLGEGGCSFCLSLEPEIPRPFQSRPKLSKPFQGPGEGGGSPVSKTQFGYWIFSGAWLLGFGCSDVRAIPTYCNQIQPIYAPLPPGGGRKQSDFIKLNLGGF